MGEEGTRGLYLITDQDGIIYLHGREGEDQRLVKYCDMEILDPEFRFNLMKTCYVSC